MVLQRPLPDIQVGRGMAVLPGNLNKFEFFCNCETSDVTIGIRAYDF